MEKSLASKEYRVFLQLLRAARKSKGITQIELAARLGVVQSFISGCEKGQRRLDIIETWRWCEALDLSFSELAKAFDEHMGKG